MGKLTMAVMLLFFMLVSMPFIQGIDGRGNEPKEVEEWFQKVSHAKQKLTKLHFYFHAIPKGKAPTQVQIAQANISSAYPFFGILDIVDYPLTVGPQQGSKLVGRAQGFYASVSLTQVTYFTSLNIIFPDGKYSGSSITTSGHNPLALAVREMPVTGGSGAFRLAQGVVTLKTHSFDLASGNATVEVNVLIFHY